LIFLHDTPFPVLSVFEAMILFACCWSKIVRPQKLALVCFSPDSWTAKRSALAIFDKAQISTRPLACKTCVAVFHFHEREFFKHNAPILSRLLTACDKLILCLLGARQHDPENLLSVAKEHLTPTHKLVIVACGPSVENHTGEINAHIDG